MSGIMILERCIYYSLSVHINLNAEGYKNYYNLLIKKAQVERKQMHILIQKHMLFWMCCDTEYMQHHVSV